MLKYRTLKVIIGLGKGRKKNGGPKSSMNFKNLETRERASRRTREKTRKQVESFFFVLSYKATAILNVGSQCGSGQKSDDIF